MGFGLRLAWVRTWCGMGRDGMGREGEGMMNITSPLPSYFAALLGWLGQVSATPASFQYCT